MKKIFSIFAALLFLGSMTTVFADTKYKLTKVTTAAEIVGGKQYVFERNSRVLKAEVSSSALQTTNSYSKKNLLGTENYLWTATAVSGGVTLKNGTTYIANSSSTGISLAASGSTWDITFDASGVALISNKSNSDRYIGETSSGSNAYKAYATSDMSKGHDFTVYVVEEQPAATVEAPTFTPNAVAFAVSVEVSLACETDGATIYYTIDGTDPDDTSEEYQAGHPFTLTETTTVRAIAIKGSDESDISEKTYTQVAALTTMDEIFAAAQAAGSTAAQHYVLFNNWLVSGIISGSSSDNVFVTDGTKGFVVNGSSMGFNVEDALSGTVQVKIKMNDKGYAMVQNLTSTSEGLTVSMGILTPTLLDDNDIAALSGVNTGGLFTIDGAYQSIDSKDYVADLQVYKGLYTYAAFESGYNYQVTGVYQQFGSAGEILPRAATDIIKGDAAALIIADNVNLGEYVTTGEWKDITIDVSSENVTEEIAVYEHSDNLMITDPVGTNLPSSGGTLGVSLDFTKAGSFVGTIDLRAGTARRVVKITATVIKQHEIPTSDTSDPKVTGVTTASDAKVKIQVSGVDSVTYDAMKLGTGSATGKMTITVGAGAEKLFFYAAAWKSEGGNIKISAPAGVTLTADELADGKLTLIADDGITSNSPFKLDKKLADAWIYLFEIELDGVTANTDITIESGTQKRFVVWGAKQYKGTATSIENAVVNENKAVKQIMNGQVIIIRNGVRYNVIGQVIE